MPLLSASLNIKDRHCIAVGPSAVGTAHWLSQHGARVTLFEVPSQAHADLNCHGRAVTVQDLEQCWLVVACSEDPETNERIRGWCEEKAIFCFAANDLERNSWQLRRAGADSSPGTGNVALVGAGPGDPELLTLRALRLIQQADVIVYDRLVSDPILGCCNPAAEFIYAGKAKSNHTLQQETINHLLVRLAQRPANVVRLKGGDPFIFGRGGEEIETLADHQIPFQVVPGITAASGCAAFAGIPLTHRDHAQSCAFVTGHLRNGEINLNWHELVSAQQTVVVYMGLTGLEKICESLIQHGRRADTPAALVQQGTQPQQRVFASTLQDLPALVARSEVSAPTLLIIGDVVTLRNRLDWFTSTLGA
jgi:uroporphyrin-III C-methyltransferase/precorrin-2 dehydrogenase/sirohydrochlorin ferrochelatase